MLDYCQSDLFSVSFTPFGVTKTTPGWSFLPGNHRNRGLCIRRILRAHLFRLFVNETLKRKIFGTSQVVIAPSVFHSSYDNIYSNVAIGSNPAEKQVLSNLSSGHWSTRGPPSRSYGFHVDAPFRALLIVVESMDAYGCLDCGLSGQDRIVTPWIFRPLAFSNSRWNPLFLSLFSSSCTVLTRPSPFLAVAELPALCRVNVWFCASIRVAFLSICLVCAALWVISLSRRERSTITHNIPHRIAPRLPISRSSERPG
ncbi:hypothetical protein BDV93DRAFT_368493 [Ceratobasidium sp. AG-I]|nr:hypothetical protein BDV93DRAFT_368493 [Ceratobasidium sp. AG-I]